MVKPFPNRLINRVIKLTCAAAILLLPAALSACAFLPTEDAPLAAPVLREYERRQLTLVAVRRDDLVQTKTISCRSRPIREQNYNFGVGGIYIERIYVTVGDSVKAGDILAELDRKDILAQVEEARLAVRKQEFALELAKEDTALRRDEYLLRQLDETEAIDAVALIIAGADEADIGRTGAEQPDGELPDGEQPDDELPDGELPDTELPDTELPDGELPDGEQPEEGQADPQQSSQVQTDAQPSPQPDAQPTEREIITARYEKTLEDYEFKVSYAERMLEIAERKLETLLEIADERVIYATIDGVISYAQRFMPSDRSIAGDKVFTVSDASELIYTVTGDEALFFAPGEVYSMRISKSYLDMRAVSPEEIGEQTPASPVMYFIPEDLTAGLATYGYITVETNRRDGALYLPAAAIIQVGEGYAVYRVGESGFRELAYIEIGVTISGKTEILHGLSEGDEVILG